MTVDEVRPGHKVERQRVKGKLRLAAQKVGAQSLVGEADALVDYFSQVSSDNHGAGDQSTSTKTTKGEKRTVTPAQFYVYPEKCRYSLVLANYVPLTWVVKLSRKSRRKTYFQQSSGSCGLGNPGDNPCHAYYGPDELGTGGTEPFPEPLPLDPKTWPPLRDPQGSRVSPHLYMHSPEATLAYQLPVPVSASTIEGQRAFTEPPSALGSLRSWTVKWKLAPVQAIPVNFRESLFRPEINGVLHYEYIWDSSTGDLADLVNCEVGESVTYSMPGNPSPTLGNRLFGLYTPPSPPWNGSGYRNPTGLAVPATRGWMHDNHWPSADGEQRAPSTWFVKPYRESTFSAHQTYGYRCNGTEPVALESHVIVRTVESAGTDSFRYVIRKDNRQNKINPLP